MNSDKSLKTGFIASVTAQIMWGLLVFYWKAIKSVTPYEILAMRIIMSAVTAAIILFCCGKLGSALKSVKSLKYAGMMFAAGMFVVLNWGSYIYGVNNNFILECSLGYFISPIITALCGVLFFKEKPDKYVITALCIVVLAVIYMTISYGKPPVFAILLAITYNGYLSTKKKINAEPLYGMLLESLFIAPIALFYVFFLMGTGSSTILGETLPVTLLLLFSGLMTMLPLLFIMISQRNISMLAIGIMSYISPTLQMLVGVFAYKEQFTSTNAVTLIASLCAISYFTFGQFRKASSALKNTKAQSEQLQ